MDKRAPRHTCEPKKQRPLTASLHTVTAVTRVALAQGPWHPSRYVDATVYALKVLGYDAEAAQIEAGRADESPLLAACLASVRKAIMAAEVSL